MGPLGCCGQVTHLTRALLNNHIIGLVNRGDPLIGDIDELFRYPTRQEFVGIVVSDEPAVVALKLVITDTGVDAEHVVRIAFRSYDMTSFDVVELGVR